MKKHYLAIVATAVVMGFPYSNTFADDQHDAHQANAPSMTTSGEVKKVDKGAGKVTVKHGRIENLDMPAMTMNFRVKDPAMLDRVKEGDKINFMAEKVNGAFTLMQIETAK